jgi:homospermidine synthase
MTRPTKMILLGCGAVGNVFLQLCLEQKLFSEYIIIDPSPLYVSKNINAVKYLPHQLTEENYREQLLKISIAGDLLVNLTGGIETLQLVSFCQEQGLLYLDTANGHWTNSGNETEFDQRTQQTYLRKIRHFAKHNIQAKDATILINHGANPGIVSHFLKKALVSAAHHHKPTFAAPRTSTDWARLACALGVRTIQIAERDSQHSNMVRAPDEFWATWSPQDFQEEGRLYAEWAWGTNESTPSSSVEISSDHVAIARVPGFSLKTKLWTPMGGESEGFLIQHSECQTIADFLTISDSEQPLLYRPTVHYSYHPYHLSLESIEAFVENNFSTGSLRGRLSGSDIVSGANEIGVMIGGDFGTWWYGINTDIQLCRSIVSNANATTLQVAAGALGAIRWMLENPRNGFNEPENLPQDAILQNSLPLLGSVFDSEIRWTPSSPKSSNPWSFKNFLLTEIKS